MSKASIILKKQNINISNQKIMAPGSKSEAIRLIIGAFLCNGITHINNVNLCDDVLRTIYAVEAMGSIVKTENKNGLANLEIIGVGTTTKKQNEVTFNIGSSATLFRMIAPVALMKYNRVTIYANHDFWERPIDEYFKLMHYVGYEDYCVLSDFDIAKSMEVDGSVSSQYASGLLFAQSLLKEETNLYVMNLESKDYLNMTAEILKMFGVEIEIVANRYRIINRHYHAIDVNVNGDYSQAAYFLTLGAFLGNIEITNLNATYQADEVILSYLKKMGANIYQTNEGVKIEKSQLHWLNDLDVSECIDLSPVFFVLAALINEDITIKGTRRLIYKESKRADSLQEEFKKLGIEIEINKNDCIIKKHDIINDFVTLNSHNDHRICMALTILSILLNIDVKIEGIESVKKSFPSFFDCLKELDIKFEKVLE